MLRYTATGSTTRNDMQILPSSFPTPLGGDPFAEEGIRFTCIMELANSAGEVRLNSTDAGEQLLATSKSGTLLLRRDQGERAES